MPLSIGMEMTEQAHTQTYGRGDNPYATREDFLNIFDQDINGLYQLSFLLTGDLQKAEKCFISGVDDCAKENRVFREWARVWAKRVIAENAIRELNPRWKYSSSSSVPAVFAHHQQLGRPSGHFDRDSVLGIADFERFVFVLCVLENYRVHECALLLGCSSREVREARTRAIAELAGRRQVAPDGRKAAHASLEEAPRV
jgi:hypothetical protein